MNTRQFSSKRKSSTKLFKNCKPTNNFGVLLEDFITPKKDRCIFSYERMEVQSQEEQENRSIHANENKQDYVPWKDTMVDFKGYEHVRINRARLYDWYIQICYAYGQSWQTLLKAISMLDRMIIQAGIISIKNLHIYGATCFWMASKYIQNCQKCISIEIFEKFIIHNRYSRKQIMNCQADIFKWIVLTAKNKSLHYPTFVDRVFERFPFLKDQAAKQILIQLFYVIQSPSTVFGSNIDITQKLLVEEVAFSTFENQRYRKCWEVEQHFLDHYGCLNARRFGMKLNL